MHPKASLVNRNIGADFSGLDGWSMYHGHRVPGFPQHPHRGFETISIIKRGFIDHSDSLRATARIGPGDVQWMTAGRGIVHCEMFPLIEESAPNPTEFFQLWLNLPARDKMTDPRFTMFWDEDVPQFHHQDANGCISNGRVIAGSFFGHTPPSPPPASWASDPAADLGILTITMQPGACLSLDAAPGTQRMLYHYKGIDIKLNGTMVEVEHATQLRTDVTLTITNGSASSELLLLQGRPINEPVAKHGPFVMNSREEIAQAIQDYRRTQFGDWPWSSSDPVHPRTERRFARHPDGGIVRPRT